MAVNNIRNNKNWYEYFDERHAELIFLNDHAKRQTYIRKCCCKVHLLLPLNKLFTFCEYNKHVFRGVKHRITLMLNLIIKAAGVDPGSVKINQMVWMIPYVEASLSMMAKLETQLAMKTEYSIQWPAVNVYKEQPP